MKDLRSWFSNGKLRLSWGQTGNSNIGGFAWGAGISQMPSALGPGYRPSNIPNTAVHWEKQEQWNVGLDLGFLDNKFNVTIDAYQKISSDMLMGMQLPSYMGTQGNGSSALAAPKGNFGTIENKGLEITLLPPRISIGTATSRFPSTRTSSLRSTVPAMLLSWAMVNGPTLSAQQRLESRFTDSTVTRLLVFMSLLMTS